MHRTFYTTPTFLQRKKNKSLYRKSVTLVVINNKKDQYIYYVRVTPFFFVLPNLFTKNSYLFNFLVQILLIRKEKNFTQK